MSNQKKIDSKMKLYRVKLTKTQKKIMTDYLTGKTSVLATAAKLGGSSQRVYTMTSSMFRSLVTEGKIDVKELLQNF